MYAAKTGRTNHPQLQAIARARMLNQLCGGAFFLPWDVDELDDDWLAVFYGLNDLPKQSKNFTDFENKLVERRNSNPTYRKYLRN